MLGPSAARPGQGFGEYGDQLADAATLVGRVGGFTSHTVIMRQFGRPHSSTSSAVSSCSARPPRSSLFSAMGNAA